jgi:hypothetical protein
MLLRGALDGMNVLRSIGDGGLSWLCGARNDAGTVQRLTLRAAADLRSFIYVGSLVIDRSMRQTACASGLSESQVSGGNPSATVVRRIEERVTKISYWLDRRAAGAAWRYVAGAHAEHDASR